MEPVSTGKMNHPTARLTPMLALLMYEIADLARAAVPLFERVKQTRAVDSHIMPVTSAPAERAYTSCLRSKEMLKSRQGHGSGVGHVLDSFERMNCFRKGCRQMICLGLTF